MNRAVAWQFPMFAVVGLVGTAAHYATLIALVEVVSVNPALSSSVGFFIGAVVNYGLNYRYTFRSSSPHAKAMPRFVLVASVGAMINALLVWLLTQAWSIHYLPAQVAATGGVLTWNFLGSRYWAFVERSKSESKKDVSVI